MPSANPWFGVLYVPQPFIRGDQTFSGAAFSSTRTSRRPPGHELQDYEQMPSFLDITLIAGVME
jgi:hypothetical protein